MDLSQPVRSVFADVAPLAFRFDDLDRHAGGG
jgi:hypothetical protein